MAELTCELPIDAARVAGAAHACLRRCADDAELQEPVARKRVRGATLFSHTSPIYV